MKSRLYYNPLAAGLLSFLVTLGAALLVIACWHGLVFWLFW